MRSAERDAVLFTMRFVVEKEPSIRHCDVLRCWDDDVGRSKIPLFSFSGVLPVDFAADFTTGSIPTSQNLTTPPK